MKKNNVQILKRIYESLKNYRYWVILSHVKPDGDTLGSASAMVQLGINEGKDVFWGGADSFSPTYSFLPFSEYYRKLSHISEVGITEKYVAVILDTSNIDRSVAGLTEQAEGSPDLVVNIDHHGDNERFGHLVHVSPDSSSTGEILWHFFRKNDLRITKGIAQALYSAIVSDSGNFSYSITSSSTHLAAADLLSAGVDPAEMNQLIYRNQSPAALNLWGRAFSRARTLGDRCVFSWLQTTDFEETGAGYPDTENLVSRLLFLRDIDFAVLFVEEENQVRVSLRSSGGISAREIAQVYGGGGHIPAAGCKLEMDLEGAKKEVLGEISRHYVFRNNLDQ